MSALCTIARIADASKPLSTGAASVQANLNKKINKIYLKKKFEF